MESQEKIPSKTKVLEGIFSLFLIDVSIVPSSHLFSKQMMSHAPRAW